MHGATTEWCEASSEDHPGVQKIGDYYYNFWKDKQHERGLWRRTTLAEYRKAQPTWETVLDLDALNKAEGTKWVWHGADCLRPAYERCLVALSPGEMKRGMASSATSGAATTISASALA